MRYNLPGGIILRTENAAKPEAQASRYLTAIIQSLPPVETAVDYGCGKLRYLSAMLDTAESVTLVDSEVQLSRCQMIRGSKGSVRSVTSASNRMSAYNTHEFAKLDYLYDRGFCINVLSAIPYAYARENALRLLARSLKDGAECLIVLQYRNSDFTRMANLPYARRWHDGILLDSLRGYSFYALISPDKLSAMVRRAGFEISDVHLNEGSVFLRAKARHNNTSQLCEFDESNSFRLMAA